MILHNLHSNINKAITYIGLILHINRYMYDAIWKMLYVQQIILYGEVDKRISVHVL